MGGDHGGGEDGLWMVSTVETMVVGGGIIFCRFSEYNTK